MPRNTDNLLTKLTLADMKKLWDLKITGDFTDKGLRHLECLKALRWLKIDSQSTASKAALQRLRNKLPNLTSIKMVPRE